MDEKIKAKSKEIQDYYKKKATPHPYATSPDFNLREIEIEYLSRTLIDGIKILDVGCGNGYSTLSLTSRHKSSFTGIDFVPDMIEQANALKNNFVLNGSVEFSVGDVTNLDFDSAYFDVVISERCLLNLPTKDLQWQAIQEISRVLKPGGRYLMLEGTIQGLNRLNSIRQMFNLDPILDADPHYNWFSNKFDEDEMIPIVLKYFQKLEHIQRFGMYYLLSRIVHPLIVAPDQPKFDSKINEIAKIIAEKIPNFNDIGHIALFIFKR
jgi:ubiquinone/menaquinone biosynthesis C-methylase UbiE